MSELTLQVARKISPRKVAPVLAGVWVFFAFIAIVMGRGIGSYNLQTFALQDSDLDSRLSTPASVTALLLLCAAGMAFALVNVDRSRRQKKWRLAGIALLAFSFEELLGIHSWLQSRGVSWAVCYLPLLLLGTAALVGALRIFHRQSAIQPLFAGGIVCWFLGGAIDNPAVAGSNSGAELLEMAAAIAFALALLSRLRYLARQYYPVDEAETRLSVDEIASEVIPRLRLRPIAIGLGIVMGVLAVQYVLLHRGNYHHAERLAILDLNNERTLSDTFQGSLLFIAGGLALLISRLQVTRDDARRWWALLGACLIPLGAEQIVAIHGRFQDATGLPGQVILVPLAAVSVVAWFKVLDEVSANRTARILFIAGAAFWLESQISDLLLNPIDAFRWTITSEETSESIGSALWAFAFVVWLRSVLSPYFTLRRPEGEPVIAPPTIVKGLAATPAEAETAAEAPSPTG